jgi:hypothetical protein
MRQTRAAGYILPVDDLTTEETGMQPSLEERAEIEDLYVRYIWALDTRDRDLLATCFVPGAVVYEALPGGDVATHEALSLLDDTHAGAQHRHSELRFEPDPAGRPGHLRTTAYAFVTVAEQLGPDAARHPGATTVWSGYYVDTVVKDGDTWRYVERNIAPWTGEVQRAGSRA